MYSWCRSGIDRRLRARPGFTVVEALVVVILIGIIGAMAVPSLGRSFAASRVDSAAQDIVREVEAAFSLAARQRKPVTIVVDSIRRRMFIRDRATSATLQAKAYGPLESPYALDRFRLSTATVTIFPNGFASGPFAIFAVAGNQGRAVQVTRVGQIRVVRP